ncbi:protein meiotic P26-like [Saccoglossus kowalevskii]|uniref:Tripartite motif-containing protein 2-like n=1 Tax=Saccoglossus kowalevskii TaxID=10224 RepID=A0ABM0GZI9_SACKO|nr:PREDICTED: tripartite motif-containing protein 2-like [Saccoglossus kowalevskii]
MSDDEQQQAVENGEDDSEQQEELDEEPAYKQVADFGWSDNGPEEARLVTPCGISVSQKGDVFVADFGDGKVKVYTKDGEFQRDISHKSEKLENFYPGDVVVSADDESIYVLGAGNFDDADNNAIVKFTYDGEAEKEIISEKLKGAISLAVNSRGLLFAVDRNRRRVIVLDQEGKFIRAIGSRGCDLGKFDTPMYLRFTRRDFLIVTDIANRIQVFDPEGSVVRLIQHVPGPTGVSVDMDDQIIVGGAGIRVLTMKGETVGIIGNRHDGPTTRGIAASKIDDVNYVFAVCCKCSLPEGLKSYVAVYQYDSEKLKQQPKIIDN